MHKGRTYPFHPEYHIPHCWFWPGFMPWRGRIEIYARMEGDWALLTPGSTSVSSPGDAQPDATEMDYMFSSDEWEPTVHLLMGFLEANFPPTDTPMLYAYVYDEVSARWSYGASTLPHPQYACVYDLADLQLIDYEGNPVGPLYIRFRPATYAEGGSPWD